MAIESFPIYSLLSRLVRWLPAFLLKRHYTPERLAQLIYLDIQPRGDSVTVDLGQAASVQLALQVINLSPFPVEIDRAKFELICGGVPINLSYLKRTKVKPGEVLYLPLRESIVDGAAIAIAHSQETPVRAWLSGHVEFNCSVQSFGKSVGALSEIYPRIINANAR